MVLPLWHDGTRDIIVIIRPYCSITYADVSCCYQPSSMVCLSLGLSVTVVNPTKMAGQIEMPFGLRSWVGSRNMY